MARNRQRDFNPFNRIRVQSPKRNLFDLSFDTKYTFNMGELIPILCIDTLPGDNFTIKPETLIRFFPMIRPTMHRIDLTIDFYYVPNRILWNNWETFLKDDSFHPPYLQGTTEFPLEVKNGGLLDYLGLPTTENLTEKVDALPVIAYFKIFHEWYQDQNNDSGYDDLGDLLKNVANANGDVTALLSSDPIGLAERAWEHDYFTSALPFAQRGEPVRIPVELVDIEADVVSKTVTTDNLNFDDVNSPLKTGAFDSVASYDLEVNNNLASLHGELISGGTGELDGTISQLRTAYALQRFLELNARSGARYEELIKANFDVDIGDGRINKPEFKGRIKQLVNISEVLQSVGDDTLLKLGDYAGHSTVVNSGKVVNIYCPEHGYIIALANVQPTTSYFQGIPRRFQRFSRLDYYWKEFAHIGEQAIKNKELFFSADEEVDNETFGYIPRYSEYKYEPSRIHGEFRSTLLEWHLGRKFENTPTLNEDFVYVYPEETSRIFNYQGGDYPALYAHAFFDIKAKRKIPFWTDPI